VSKLLYNPGGVKKISVGMSADAARMSARATPKWHGYFMTFNPRKRVAIS
jgi:hypothetical protein